MTPFLVRVWAALFGWMICTLGFLPPSSACEQAEAGNTRRFQFDYAAKATGLPAGAQVSIWIPLPPSSAHQQVEQLGFKGPGKIAIQSDPQYGNQIGYFQAAAPASGEISVTASYEVNRKEVRGLQGGANPKPSPEQLRRALAGSQRVPLGGKPAGLIADVAFPEDDDEVAVARRLYEVVEKHMKYDKSRPGYGAGDAVWACSSRYGNCTDFHSLFMSLARTKGVAAEFEIGFPLPAQRGAGAVGGYHCWAFFYSRQHGWVPVDISEADKHPEKKRYFFGNLDENRVAFTLGRDIQLVPEAAAGPLNYFVYPHIEVDGRVLPRKQIELHFSYADRR